MVCCLLLDNSLNIDISEYDVVNGVQGVYRRLVFNSDPDIYLEGLRKLQINWLKIAVFKAEKLGGDCPNAEQKS
jgi:hypothetical protein